MRRLACFICMLLLHSLLCGQSLLDSLEMSHAAARPRDADAFVVLSGPQKPEHPPEGTWYYDQDQEDGVWIYIHGEWKHLDDPFMRYPRLDGGLVRIKYSDGYSLATLEGVLLITFAVRLQHEGNLFFGNDVHSRCGFVIRNDGDTLSLFANGWGDDCLRPITIDGQTFLSIPAYFPNAGWFSSNQQCNWGLLDTLGRWIIAPQYDGPILFNNGVAEVKYYGEPRKINLKGERVE